MTNTYFILFNILIFIGCILDFFILNKSKNFLKVSVILTLFWILFGIGFSLVIYHLYGLNKTFEYLSAYFIEKTLSIDNLFVFFYIFLYFKIPLSYQTKILFIGIFSAILFRFFAIYVTFELINKFSCVITILGLFLLYCGVRPLFFPKQFSINETDDIKKVLEKIPFINSNIKIKNTNNFNNKRINLSHYFISLIVIEIADILFACDSIPAIFSVTNDKMIAYTANIFAILGLRSLYHVFAIGMAKIYYLKIAVSIILIMVGSKMIFSEYIQIKPLYYFFTLLIIVAVTFVASFYKVAHIKKRYTRKKDGFQ